MSTDIADAACDNLTVFLPSTSSDPAKRSLDPPVRRNGNDWSGPNGKPHWLRALYNWHIAIVMPAYNEAEQIDATLRTIPDYVTTIIIVDDASQDGTADVVERHAENDKRIAVLRHTSNQGVGGAMVSGFDFALAGGAEIVVKMDADGQMSPSDLPALLFPLISGQADYSKGNRFRDFASLRKMPAVRRFGNAVLSFLTKASVGYWSCFDPCNGYVAIRSEILQRLPKDRISKSFFFETSMLANLNLLGAVVCDVDMPARYGAEVSHLSIRKTLWEFPLGLLACLLRRILLKDFLYDFTMVSVYLLTGLPLFIGGVIHGSMNWHRYANLGEGAPTGTVVIPTLLIILGFQLLLSALNEDIRRTPHTPLSRRWRRQELEETLKAAPWPKSGRLESEDPEMEAAAGKCASTTDQYGFADG